MDGMGNDSAWVLAAQPHCTAACPPDADVLPSHTWRAAWRRHRDQFEQNAPDGREIRRWSEALQRQGPRLESENSFIWNVF